MEVGETVEALDLLNLEFHNSPRVLVFVLLVQVGVGNLENAASKGVSGNVLACSLVAGGQSGHSDFKKTGCAHVVPLLLQEGVLHLLLLLSLLLEVSWVLSGSHVLKFRSDAHKGVYLLINPRTLR